MLASSCRAPDFLVGVPTGSSFKTGSCPGTQNSRYNLLPQLNRFFNTWMFYYRFQKTSDRPQKKNETSFFLMRRSDADASIRRQGCKSLEHAQCVVSQHQTFSGSLLCQMCCVWESTTFAQGNFICSHLQSRAKDSCFFTLKCFDSSVHHFKVSPEDDPEATRKVRSVSPGSSLKQSR